MHLFVKKEYILDDGIQLPINVFFFFFLAAGEFPEQPTAEDQELQS